MSQISVVVRTLNESRFLDQLLDGIASQSMKADEILVVDSGSTDETVSIATSRGCRVFEIEPKRFTYGRSLNLGFAEAKGDIVVVVSAHVYPVHTDFLQQLTSPFQHEDVAMVYGRQVGDDSSKFSEKLLLEGWFPGESEPWQTYPFANNANSAVRRVAWEQFKFDESLPALEDIEFAKRAQSRGWRVAYAPNAEVVHVHEEVWTQVKRRYQREASALAQIFPSVKFGVARGATFFLRNLFTDLTRASREKELKGNFTSVVLFRFWQMAGFLSGFRKHPEEVRKLMHRYFYSNEMGRQEVPPQPQRTKITYGAGSLPSEHEK